MLFLFLCPEIISLAPGVLFSRHDGSSTEAPTCLLPHTSFPFCPKSAIFSPFCFPLSPLFTPALCWSEQHDYFEFSGCVPLPTSCRSILPERAQVLPGGNDCYLQDTLHITSTPFGVFRPSSFCCVSHFTPRARVLKDQGLLFTAEARQAPGLLEVETFFLPRTSGRHSRPVDVLRLASRYTHQR